MTDALILLGFLLGYLALAWLGDRVRGRTLAQSADALARRGRR